MADDPDVPTSDDLIKDAQAEVEEWLRESADATEAPTPPPPDAMAPADDAAPATTDQASQSPAATRRGPWVLAGSIAVVLIGLMMAMAALADFRRLASIYQPLMW